MFLKFLNDTAFCMNEDPGASAGGGGDAGGAANPPANSDPAPAPAPPVAPPADAPPAGDAGKAPAPANPPADAPPADKPVVSPMFTDKWREEYATGADGTVDEAKLARLQRYTDPRALIDALMQAQDKIRAGDVLKPLPKDATPEQVAEYRKALGIPEKPEQYLDALPEGLVLSDVERAGAAPFLKEMHDLNASPAVTAAALASYQKMEAAHTEAIQAHDLEVSTATIAALRQEWGADFKTNMGAIENFLQRFPADVQDSLRNARLGDAKGTPLLANANIARMFAMLEREYNPAGTVTAGQGMDNLSSIEGQIKEYEKQMGTKAWFSDEKAQAHYRQLLDQRERYGAK